jgi:hypothetical protein
VTAAHADALADVTVTVGRRDPAAFFDHHELLADDAGRDGHRKSSRRTAATCSARSNATTDSNATAANAATPA